jgi:glycosyltransferase involved in cell wall biosynthesis
MPEKKILIVSRSFYPGLSPRAYRTTELAKELSKQGHDVTIYIPFGNNNYSRFAKEHNLRVNNIGNLNWLGIELKGGKIEYAIRRAIRRGLLMLFEYPDVELTFRILNAIKNESGYDLLISIAVPFPVHWGVALAKRKGRDIAECWIADCGDPYMGDTADSFRKLNYFGWIEKWFCRKADYLTVPFEGAIPAYYPEFHDKIRVIPQGYDFKNLVIPEYKKRTEYPVFAYAGGFIPGKRDPSQLLRFLSRCQREFKFIVYTSQESMLIEARKKLGGKLEIKPLIPREELLINLSQMDFLVNLDNNITTQLPSKLIDYAYAGRPVLNILANDDFSGLTQFMEGDYTKRMNLVSPENFEIDKIAKKFISLCDAH